MHEEKNIGGGAEYPGSDEQKISEMLLGLERVEAPKDFDFRLKARLANARPEQYRMPGLFPILKYAMPLALFLVVGAGVMLNGWYANWQAPNVAVADVSGEEESSGQSAVNTSQLLVPGTPSPSIPALPANRVVPNTTGPLLAVSGPSSEIRENPGPRIPVRSEPTPSGGSRLMGGGNENIEIRLPKGFEANNTNTSLVKEPVLPVKPIAVIDALRSIGIEANLESGKWIVKAVKEAELAGRMGMKAGDQIESIDGGTIDGGTVFNSGSFKVKTIRVRRSGSSIDLEMPKPE